MSLPKRKYSKSKLFKSARKVGKSQPHEVVIPTYHSNKLTPNSPSVKKVLSNVN